MVASGSGCSLTVSCDRGNESSGTLVSGDW